MRVNFQGFTLIGLLIPIIDTTYCDVVLIGCHEPVSSYCVTLAVVMFRSPPYGGLGSISGMLMRSKSALSPPFSVQFTVIFTAPLTSSEKSMQERVGTEGGPE